MSIPILSSEPREIFQGRTVKWTKSLSDFPAGTWQLNYSILYGAVTASLAWGTNIVASGSDFLVTLPATLITGLTAGVQGRLNGSVTSGGEVATVYDGALSIKVAGELSHARQTLTAIEAMMAGNASSAERDIEVSAGGISQRLGMCDKRELMALHSYYRALVSDEEAAENVAAGKGSGRLIRNRHRELT